MVPLFYSSSFHVLPQCPQRYLTTTSDRSLNPQVSPLGMSLPRPVMFKSFDTSVLPHVHRTVGRMACSIASQEDLAALAPPPVLDAADPWRPVLLALFDVALPVPASPSMARFHIELRLGLRLLYGLVSTWERVDAAADLDGGPLDPAPAGLPAPADINLLLSATSAWAILRCCFAYRDGSCTSLTKPPSLSSLGVDAGGLGFAGRSEGGRFRARFLPEPVEEDGEGPPRRSARGSCAFLLAATPPPALPDLLVVWPLFLPDL
mmetsp:Transcript_1025/g.2853  ORF Transcript_1025/g.2853 Transcript_1025/m.2853 type:complete len:263 (-) Transcript_1025:625-1413(-)